MLEEKPCGKPYPSCSNAIVRKSTLTCQCELFYSAKIINYIVFARLTCYLLRNKVHICTSIKYQMYKSIASNILEYFSKYCE